MLGISLDPKGLSATDTGIGVMTLFMGFVSHPVGRESSFEAFFKLLAVCQILMMVQPLKMGPASFIWLICCAGAPPMPSSVLKVGGLPEAALQVIE